MKLIETLNNVVVEQPVAIINYLDYEETQKSDSRYSQLKVKNKLFNLQTFQTRINTNTSQIKELESLGINWKMKMLQVLDNDCESNRDKYVFNNILELGKNNKIANLPIKWYDKILFKLFKYEKIRNVKDLNTYLNLMCNLMQSNNRMKLPNYIIVNYNILLKLQELPNYVNNFCTEIKTNYLYNNLVGSIGNLNVYCNVNGLTNDEIIFGTQSNSSYNFLNYIKLKDSTSLDEITNQNGDIIITSRTRETVAALDNAYKFFLYDKISLEKRNFWTYIKNNIKKLWKTKN